MKLWLALLFFVVGLVSSYVFLSQDKMMTKQDKLVQALHQEASLYKKAKESLPAKYHLRQKDLDLLQKENLMDAKTIKLIQEFL